MRLVFPKITKQSFGNIILKIFGISIMLYFTIASILWKRFDVFNFLVSLTGAILIFLSFKINFILVLTKKCPNLILRLLTLFLLCLALSFVIIQSIIIYNMRNTSKVGADYIIVLGCQVAGEYASLPLLSRGYAAIKYLKNNPETKAVLTGGQGHGENISEAESLRRLLLENKIDKERILLEDKSKNTMENFIFSNKLYNLLEKNIIIVTSDYHMFRSLSIAKKLKYTNVSGLPSKSQRSILPAFLLREYVTVIYYKIFRKI
jgi:uncharacterized SAM-binding protein YcdF (DUF218 family)